MVECGQKTQNAVFSIILYVIVSVFFLCTKEAVQGAPIALDVSRVRINPLECYDRVKSCSKEAKNGFCASNYHYMIDRCPWSCRFCRKAGGDTDKCEDIDQHCPEWVSNNECATRPDYMAQNCKKSCEMCGPESEYKVSDSEPSCPIWAKAGWCQKNSDLLKKCPHSCQKFGYMGANSMEERYITVNFQNTSQVTATNVTDFAAPPPPSAAIRPHSELESLPADLKSVLEKEWWNSKLLQLTQKQNEYVTHPELRQPSFPLYTNSSSQSGNNTLLGRKQINGSQVLTNLTSSQGFINQSSILQGGNKQEQLNEPPAPAPPPRPYDSLLPQLAVSGLTWNGKRKKAEENQADGQTAQKTESSQDVIWKEEKEEDEDLDAENGQQKEEVPVIVSGNYEISSGHEPRVEMLPFGNKEVKHAKTLESQLTTSGENFENYHENTEGHVTSSSGSGEEMDSEEQHDVSMYNSPESTQEGDVKRVFPESDISGSGQHSAQEIDDNETSSDGSRREDNVKQGFPKNNIRSVSQLHQQESGDFESGSSGSNQYEDDVTFSGSGE